MDERLKLERAVDLFAEEMKTKLLKKMLERRSGWNDPNGWCSSRGVAAHAVIRAKVRQHLNKSLGTEVEDRSEAWVDVANFAMFGWALLPGKFEAVNAPLGPDRVVPKQDRLVTVLRTEITRLLRALDVRNSRTSALSQRIEDLVEEKEQLAEEADELEHTLDEERRKHDAMSIELAEMRKRVDEAEGGLTIREAMEERAFHVHVRVKEKSGE